MRGRDTGPGVVVEPGDEVVVVVLPPVPGPADGPVVEDGAPE